MENIKNFFSLHGLKIYEGLAWLLLGIVIIQIITAITKKLLLKTKFQTIVITFVISLIKLIAYFFLLMLIANYLGIKTSGFLAIATALSLAISLALKDILSNIVSGAIMISTKPFSEGDFVQINDVSGIIKSINMIRTTMLSVDNKLISIPNAQIMTSCIINYNGKNTRRLDITFSVGIGENVEKIKSIISALQNKYIQDHLALDVPEPFVRLYSINENTITFSTKTWVESKMYWTLYHQFTEDIYNALLDNNINFNKQINISLQNEKELHSNEK